MLDKQIKSRTMKLLFVFEALQTNGATKSLIALLNAVCKDYDISLFLFKRDKVAERELSKDITLLDEDAFYASLVEQMKTCVGTALRSGNFKLAWFRFRVFLERMFRRPFAQWNKLNTIKGVYDIAIGYSDGFVSEVVCNKVEAARKILWLHINPMLDSLPDKSLKAMQIVDGVVGVSKDCVENLERLVGEDKLPRLFVVHNIVDEKELKRLAAYEKASLPGDGYKILTVGRLTKEKGHIRIPTILKILMDKGICADWSIVGAGLTAVKDGVIAKAQELGIADHIHFLGAKENPYSYYVVADCYAQTSFAEGWCMTISEALALGVPVVCNDLPVFHEQVIDGVNGFCAKDEGSFADALAMVLKSEANLRMDGDSPCHMHRVVQEFNEVVASYL